MRSVQHKKITVDVNENSKDFVMCLWVREITADKKIYMEMHLLLHDMYVKSRFKKSLYT